MLATTPTLTEAPDTESMRTLTTCLPEELLSRLLGFVPESAFTAQFTHELAVRLPALAAVCVTFRRALLASSKIALRFSGLRPAPHDWDQIIRVITKRRKLRPDVLLLDNCNIKPATLAGLLHAQPLSVVSIRRCHSLQGETLNSLPDDTAARALLCSGLDTPLLGASLPKLASLRVLGLVDCRLRLSGLLALLPALPALRCLLLGGALVEEELEAQEAASHPDSPISPPALALGGAAAPGLAALALALAPRAAAAEAADGAAGGAAAESEAVPAGGGLVALVEVTWQTRGVRAALRRACPAARQLDLCARGGAVSAGRDCGLRLGLDQLGGLLRAALVEHGGHAAAAALVAALNCRNGRRATPLHQAAFDGDAAAAQLLLAHGARADVKDIKGCTPLHRALWGGHEAVVALLLARPECSRIVTNHAMETPLYLAALRGHVGCLRLLLHGSGCGDEGGDGGSTIAGGSGGGGGDDGGGGGGGGGADLAAAVRPAAAFDGCLYHDGYTPLHAAVIGRSVECAALLLEAGFDRDATNRFLQTPLHLAARVGSQEAVQLLLDASACPLARDERHQQAWQVTDRSHTALAALLREATEAAQAAQGGGKPGGQNAASGGQSRRRRGGRHKRERAAAAAGASVASVA